MKTTLQKGANQQQAPNTTPLWKNLESALSELIADETSGLGDLSQLSERLSRNERYERTPAQKAQIKADLQNSKLISCEGGERNGMRFGFEELGDDIQPTFTPNGDLIIPLTFRYNAQSRIKLLILHAKAEQEKIHYQLPRGKTLYEIVIGKETFSYELRHDQKGFHLTLTS